jgi:hypothetical protein
MVQRKKVSNLVGQKFNKLTVVGYAGLGKHNKHYWICSCECGGSVKLNTSRITGGYTKSCGCLRKESMKINRADPERHGLHKHKLYQIYYSMLYRCSNQKVQRWKYYGGKGVSVCDDWRDSFMSFYDWAMSNGYKDGLSIDRIDSNLNYDPANCRWITVSENTRRLHDTR